MANAVSPTAPKMSGTRVHHELHGYWTPPHVSGMRKLVVAAMKSALPNRSIH
jgi:hypothetical protein